MKLRNAFLGVVALCLPCCTSNLDAIAEPLTADCPPSGCSNGSCIGRAEGDKCLGYEAAEERGWVGFCIATTCTEYVPVQCSIMNPISTVTGCDGSGKVTSDLRIDFTYNGFAYGGPTTCSGVEGEFGYCRPGSPCVVSQTDGTVVGQGTCL